MAYELQVSNINYDPTRFLTVAGEVLERAKNEHRAAEIAYGELAAKADEYEKLANDVRGRDSQAYINYKNYANALRQHTDLLATQGITPGTFRNIMQAKNDYARIISPIEEAWKARDREAQRQAKYLEQHPSAMFERDARDMSIDQWVANPHYVAKSIDRETVANRAKERYAALQNQIMQMVSMGHIDPRRMNANDVRTWTKANAPWLYETMEKYGVNPDEVKAFMAGDPNTVPSLLNSVARETLGMYGMANWNTDYDHYSAEQNRLRRQNMDNMLLSTITGEAPNAIKDSKFDKYADNISGDLKYKYDKMAQDKELAELELALKEKQYELNKWIAENSPTKEKGTNDPKLHTFYRDFERLVPHTDVETTQAAQLLAIKNLIDSPYGYAFLSYDENQIKEAAKKLFGVPIEQVDFSDNTSINKLLEKLYNDNYGDVSANLFSATTPEESQNAYFKMATDNIVNQLGKSVYSPITTDEYKRLITINPEDLSLDDAIRMYGYYQQREDAYNLGSGENPFLSGGLTDVEKQEKRELEKAIIRKGSKKLGNPYNKKIDDLIGTDDADLYDYATRVNNYIHGATTAYLGAEDNFTGQATETQSELLMGQSIGKQTSDGYSVNLHTLDEKGNKVNVKQQDVQAALGIDKNGKITRPYRVSIVPIRDKNGILRVQPMIRTSGYNSGAAFEPPQEYTWDHTSVRENAPQRTEQLKLMNICLSKLENVKKSDEFKKAVTNINNRVEEAAKNGQISNNPISKSLYRDNLITKELYKLQRPLLEEYQTHKKEFMRLWAHATHNTNTEDTYYESHTGESDFDAKTPM
jgi:hypothetical protein